MNYKDNNVVIPGLKSLPRTSSGGNLLSFWKILPLAAVILLAACSDDDKTAGGTEEDAGIIAIENKTVSGVSQKGPFVNGSSVTVYGLDGETLAQTGNIYEGKIRSDMGDFSVKVVKLASQYALLKANGFYRNEITGKKSNSQMTLYALTDLSDRDEVNVNLLTHLAYERSLYLATEDSLSVGKAKKQAEMEVFKSFEIEGDFASAEDLNIFGENDQSAALLAISVLMQGDLNEADFSERLANYAADMEQDGKWDDEKTATLIADWAAGQSLSGGLTEIRNNVSSWGMLMGVPNFEKYVKNFWWQNYGLGTCGKKREGEVLKNQNKASVNVDEYYICKSESWNIATQREKDGVSSWNDTTLNLAIRVGAYSGLVYVYSDSAWEETSYSLDNLAAPVDYSKGRAMNKRLGKGINLGNSWDSQGNSLDCSWGNCIEDNDFAVIKKTGFNSVRLPVRWQQNSDYSTHTVDPERLEGVKEDIKLALAQDLAVIVNFHHYVELNNAGNKFSTDPAIYNAEKEHFLLLWAQVAAELNAIAPDSMLVFEILNEPTIANAKMVDELLNDAYKIIRATAPGKTIMFESYAAKFADLSILHLPQDGNIIYSGHYYEPFDYSHQGHSYACKGDAVYANNAMYDFQTYVTQATILYPDVNGGHIPMNMGEFGILGGGDFANSRECDADGVLPSARMKAQWAEKSIEIAESLDMSWHYWGFTKVGGFEAYDRNEGSWYEGFPAAFGL